MEVGVFGSGSLKEIAETAARSRAVANKRHGGLAGVLVAFAVLMVAVRVEYKQLIHLRQRDEGFAEGGVRDAFLLLVALRGLRVETQGVEDGTVCVGAAGLGGKGRLGQQPQTEQQAQT